MITWHIMFDQGMWKWGRSVGHKTFFFKKPYLYQASVDMVYSIFLSLFNTFFSPILQWSLGTSCLTKECEKEVAQWVNKLFSSKNHIYFLLLIEQLCLWTGEHFKFMFILQIYREAQVLSNLHIPRERERIRVVCQDPLIRSEDWGKPLRVKNLLK